MFKVHVGYTAMGRDRWKSFKTLSEAQALCKEVHSKTGKILWIKEVLPSVGWKPQLRNRRAGNTMHK